MSEPLKPCPFCGGGAVKWREHGGKSQRKPYVAASCISESCAASNWELPVKEWNTRAAEKGEA
jgi:hypothetical protein